MNTKKNKPPKQVCASWLSAEVIEHERALAALEEAKGKERKYRRRLKTVRIDERTVAASINRETIQLIKNSLISDGRSDRPQILRLTLREV